MSTDIGFLEELEVSLGSPEFSVSSFNVPSESSLIPKVGCFLGLDISDLSSGITIYRNGKKEGANIALEEISMEDCHREVKLRRALKEDMRKLFLGETLDLVLIEDAYQGINPNTTRLLYALNTAIDEMILDEEVYVKKFKRVGNKEWKGWLYSIDKENLFKGMKDKPRIEACLNMLGIHEEGEGFQDRLDSCGMICGYFLSEAKILIKESEKKQKNIPFSDMDFDYQEDADLAILSAGYGQRDIDRMYVSIHGNWSKSKMLTLLKENPNKVIISEKAIKLGNLGVELGLPFIKEGGYLAFWIKPNRLKKYVSEEDLGGL